MPIQLDDISALHINTPAKRQPTFFSPLLTGRGGNTGLLNSQVRLDRSIGSRLDMPHVAGIEKYSHGATTEHIIPLTPILPESIVFGKTAGMRVPVPDIADMFCFTADNLNTNYSGYVNVTPALATLTITGADSKPTKNLIIYYSIELYLLDNSHRANYVPLKQMLLPSVNLSNISDPHAIINFTNSPLDDIPRLIHDNIAGINLDYDKFVEWADNYSVYEAICKQAELWGNVDVLSEMFSNYLDTVLTNYSNANDENKDLCMSQALNQLSYLETYDLPLETYRNIHKSIVSRFDSEIQHKLVSHNINLLMNDTMFTLNKIYGKLAVPPPEKNHISLPADPQSQNVTHQHSWKRFSLEQQQAIMSKRPLSLVTAGAGTGKSTTILGRINYLVSDCGVKPEDITVLSFTNAAADNILDKSPGIGSMTIARMVLDIYAENYPTHKLSTPETIINTLSIRFPHDDVIAEFCKYLLSVSLNKTSSFTKLNIFVEEHFTLELQIIISYQRIDTMREPQHTMGKFLIVDEVQDTSIFEFIYLLRYVIKHNQNLFIVGDASQTLYEFRSANPKALNALEGSGVFTTYKLTTNYRSNQEILDFANVHLANIEANSIANIRLQANNLTRPTKKSFTRKVQLNYTQVKSQTEFLDFLSGLMQNVAVPYINDCLARGEKVAFLAYQGRVVRRLEQLLRDIYPNTPITNLVSTRIKPTTVFSRYIKNHWDEVVQVTPGDAPLVITKGVMDNLENLIGRNATKMKDAVLEMLSKWWVENANQINLWVSAYDSGQLTSDMFFDQLQDNVLGFEIKTNAVKQLVVTKHNRDRKDENKIQNADLFVSTIHGVKGLEFDNVVVLHNDNSRMSEDQKRMFYVAFTRAMNTELILSSGSTKSAKILYDYEGICEVLTIGAPGQLIQQENAA